MSWKTSKALFLASCLAACAAGEEPVAEAFDWGAETPFELDYTLPLGLNRAEGLFAPEGAAMGESDLIEASGIVMSKANPGFLWTHEDKGNTNELFLLDAQTGETVKSVRLGTLFNRDWEDIELGPGPDPNKQYLYVGEVGDNDRVYRDYKIYRLEEPEVLLDGSAGPQVISNEQIETILFTYPDRRRHDVETLLLDPWTKDLFLVTKRDFFSMIYVLPYPQDTENAQEAILVGSFPFTRAVGGNISFDGREMLLKTYEHVLFWQREEGETMRELFQKTPLLAPYNPVEPQGEAICFDAEKGYFTLSEFSNAITPVLYHYERLRQ
ncbi:hypothetical protein [Nitritalea halalkaliphila]|nr:hypothetical protein [Nitritalea halalkaliphila]